MHAGRRCPDNEEAILAGFSELAIPAAEKLPEGQGFSVERVDLQNDGKTWLALTRKPSGSVDLFLLMACDIAGSLDAEYTLDEHRLVRVFLGRVRAWQEFMRKGAQVLSPEAEIGLVGEISILAAIIDAGIAPDQAIESWVGPLDGVQDFEIGTGAIEVKATLSPVGFSARIGSLEQLDDAVRQPLFVAGARFAQKSGGRNLPEFVDGVRQLIDGHQDAGRLFSERVLAAGYFDMHSDRYPRRFELSSTRVLEVADRFPRLTRGTVPTGISKVKYEIDLDKSPGESVGIELALKKLGAL
ncbi:hypothetical protein M2244_001209 [Rhodoferax antarcticus]|nr:hypothetical protein [Rhodoferax antarcticus]